MAWRNIEAAPLQKLPDVLDAIARARLQRSITVFEGTARCAHVPEATLSPVVAKLRAVTSRPPEAAASNRGADILWRDTSLLQPPMPRGVFRRRFVELRA